ncbi:MAG: hypothetical protein WCA89_07330, partial [Terracidiphilus sp.]
MGCRVSGTGIGAAATAGDGRSLPKVRSSSVNPALPCPPANGSGEADALLPPGSAAGAFSGAATLSADAIRIRSSNSGEFSAAPPPNTTLCTTGSDKAFGAGTGCGAGCGFATSVARFPWAS